MKYGDKVKTYDVASSGNGVNSSVVAVDQQATSTQPAEAKAPEHVAAIEAQSVRKDAHATQAASPETETVHDSESGVPAHDPVIKSDSEGVVTLNADPATHEHASDPHTAALEVPVFKFNTWRESRHHVTEI